MGDSERRRQSSCDAWKLPPAASRLPGFFKINAAGAGNLVLEAEKWCFRREIGTSGRNLVVPLDWGRGQIALLSRISAKIGGPQGGEQ